MPLQFLQHISFSQAWWFRFAAIVCFAALVMEVYIWRIRSIRKKHKQDAELAEQVATLHAKALRAQMNPHFIFNCLNSLKLLVQENQNDKAVHYIHTFSSFIRNLLERTDLTHTSLSEEIEHCRLYLDMESLRFQGKFDYFVEVDHRIDLKMVQVPVLLLQPLIENALWHGIMPLSGKGEIRIMVKLDGESVIRCSVEDNGIGRAAAARFNLQNARHQSKGVAMLENRIKLHNLLYENEVTYFVTDRRNKYGEPYPSGELHLVYLNKKI